MNTLNGVPAAAPAPSGFAHPCLTLVSASLLLLSTTAASATSPGGVLSDFGLVGSWSNDCAYNIAKELDVSEKVRVYKKLITRFNFVASFSGKSTAVVRQTWNWSPTDKTTLDIWEYHWDITSATKVTADKVKLSYTMTKTIDFQGQNDKPTEPPVVGVVFEKVGDKMRRDEWLLEQCLD